MPLPSFAAAALAGDVSAFAGTRLNGRIPVRESLINELLRRAGKRKPGGRVKEVVARFGANNLIEVAVRVAVGPFTKWFRPQFVVSQHIVGANSTRPLLVLSVASAEYAGLLWIVQLFAAEFLPQGARLDGSRILIDLSAVPQLRPAKALWPHFHTLAIRTGDGVAYLHFDLGVNGDAERLAASAVEE